MMTPAQPALPDRLLLSWRFDPARLEADLRRAEQAGWVEHFVRQNYRGRWDVLPLRIPAGATHPVMMIYSDPIADRFEDGPFLASLPYLREVLSTLRCPVQTARLIRLTPGSEIREHRDHDLAAERGTARLHVPITTNDGVEFRLNGLAVPMRPSEAWYVRLCDPHAVFNRGVTDRVHLVIDVIADDWLMGVLADAAVGVQAIRASSVSVAGSG